MFLIILFGVALLAAELIFSDVVQWEKYKKYKEAQKAKKEKKSDGNKVKINWEVVGWAILVIAIAIAASIV